LQEIIQTALASFGPLVEHQGPAFKLP